MDHSALLGRVSAHFFTEAFQSVIDDFIKANCSLFVDVTAEEISGEENKLA